MSTSDLAAVADARDPMLVERPKRPIRNGRPIICAFGSCHGNAIARCAFFVAWARCGRRQTGNDHLTKARPCLGGFSNTRPECSDAPRASRTPGRIHLGYALYLLSSLVRPITACKPGRSACYRCRTEVADP
jgi:hypothetical protein